MLPSHILASKNGWSRYPYRNIFLLISFYAFLYGQDTLRTYQLDSIAIVDSTFRVSPKRVYSLLLEESNLRIASRLDQYLASIEGFYLQDYGGLTTLKTLRVRGFSSQYTSYSINSIPIVSPTSGTVNLALFPLSLFSRMEYEAVPRSTLYPFLAGNINLGLPQRPQKYLHVGFGNYGYTELTYVDVQKTISSSFSYLSSNNDFHYALNEEKGRRKPYPGRLGSFALNWTPVQSFSHEVSTFVLASLQNAFIPPPIVKNNVTGEVEYLSQSLIANGWRWSWMPSLFTSLSTGIAFLREQLYYQTRFQLSQYRSQNVLLFHQFKRNWGTHETSLEVKWEMTQIHSNQYGYRGSIGLVQRQVSAVGMTETFFLLNGWQFHWKHQLEFSPQYPVFYQWGGILEKKKSGSGFWLSLHRGRRIPSMNELYFANFGNPNILPEKAFASECAYHVSMKRKPISSQLVLFYTETQDKIVAIPIHPARWTLITLGKSLAYGGSAVIQGQWNQNLQMEWNLTYQKTVDHSIAKGNQLPYFPVWTSNFFLKATWHSWSGQLQYQYFGSRYADLGNLTLLAPYHLVNLRFMKTWKWHSVQIQFLLEVFNLLDQPYELIRSYPMPSRYFQFAFRFSTG